MKNNQPSQSKSILILVIVVSVSAIGYFYFQGAKMPETGLLSADSPMAPVSPEILVLLNQITELKIDKKFFEDNKIYSSLKDYTVPIPDLDVGRQNPFAPVPGMPSDSAPKK